MKVNQFCDRVRDRLDAVAGRLMSVKMHLKALPMQAEQVRTRLAVQKHCALRTAAKRRVGFVSQTAEAAGTISRWKAQCEALKLSGLADRAETYAADAIECAVASIDEAERAIVNAVGARIDADVAKYPARSTRSAS